MSRHHYVQAHEANSVEHDAQHLSAHDLQELYGIQFFENPDLKTGRVWDPVSGKEFASLADWVAHQIQEEQWSDMAHQHQTNHLYDDEDYF